MRLVIGAVDMPDPPGPLTSLVSLSDSETPLSAVIGADSAPITANQPRLNPLHGNAEPVGRGPHRQMSVTERYEDLCINENIDLSKRPRRSSLSHQPNVKIAKQKTTSSLSWSTRRRNPRHH